MRPDSNTPLPIHTIDLTGQRRTLQDLTGKTFGFWTVLKYAGFHKNQTFWTCECFCGTIRDIPGNRLKRNDSKSCGCSKGLLIRQAKSGHGMAYTVEYAIWTGMVQRCHNPNRRSYNHYGGRGITVCERWRDSFENFYADVGPRPSPKHTLERLDGTKGYEPGNVLWDTHAAQARNRTSTAWITYDGVTLCTKDMALKYGLKPRTLSRRLHAGWPIEQALTTPVTSHVHIHRQSTVWVTYDGVTLCAQDMALRYGLKPDTFRMRLKNGWSVEEALTRPVSPR